MNRQPIRISACGFLFSNGSRLTMRVSDQLRAAMRASGKSLKAIAKGSGISAANLGRFLSDDPGRHRDIRLEATADKLAEYFGLELTPLQSAGESSDGEGQSDLSPAT